MGNNKKQDGKNDDLTCFFDLHQAAECFRSKNKQKTLKTDLNKQRQKFSDRRYWNKKVSIPQKKEMEEKQSYFTLYLSQEMIIIMRLNTSV